MKLTQDESRALSFIAGLLLLSAAVRLVAAHEPVTVPGGGFDLQAHIRTTREAVAEAERAERPLGEGERIDPNTADAIELDRLPRVGPSLAARIIEDREVNGAFRSAEDLGRVRGIGERMLQELAPHLSLSRPSRMATARTPRGSSLPSAGPAAPAEDGRSPAPLDLNRADAAALATLPGIGPVLAGRIVAYRDSAGPFQDMEALGAVKGVGPATLERLKELVHVGG